MKRVAHLLGPSAGGIRRHVAYLAAHPPPGWSTTAVAGPPDLARFFGKTGLPFWPRAGLAVLRAMPDVDLVHAHGLSVGAVAFRRRPPVVLTLHMDIDTQGRTASSQLLRALAPRIAKRADARIAVSQRIGSRFPDATVIPPAFEPLPPPQRDRTAVRAELDTPSDAVVALAVGRLHRDKGLDTFIDGAHRSGAWGWIAGDGPAQSELARLAEGTRIRLLGHRSDIADLLAAADVFALPAVGEGYGIAVVEALSCGVPVVVSDAGAMRELAGDAGLLVPPGNREAFCEAMTSIVSDRALRHRLGERARARSFPAPEELARRVGEVYDEVCP